MPNSQKLNKVVLLVDDSPTQRQIVTMALLETDYRLEFTSDIWISPLVTKLRPRVILIDVGLDKSLTGPDLVKALNRARIRKDILIYLYSARSEEELEALSADCRADGWIKKGGFDEIQDKLVAILAELDQSLDEK